MSDPGRDSPSVLLVDEDAILRRAVRDLLEEDSLRILAEASDAEQGFALAVELAPDIITMAIPMRGNAGIEGTRRIREVVPDARIVILTRRGEAARVAAAIGVGACGCLLTDDPPGEIVAGIRVAADGASPFSPRIAAELLDLRRGELANSSAPELTRREREVLRLLARGRSNAEIASELAVSVATVKRHLSHLLVKLRSTNRTQAAVEAVRRGLV
ncbi:MAG TPA: response regulator transcription factor [Solirubrobacterales bacterium]|nr:response regulator transcription factor [Solirubrobacterales bacterium]